MEGIGVVLSLVLILLWYKMDYISGCGKVSCDRIYAVTIVCFQTSLLLYGGQHECLQQSCAVQHEEGSCLRVSQGKTYLAVSVSGHCSATRSSPIRPYHLGRHFGRKTIHTIGVFYNLDNGTQGVPLRCALQP